MKMEQLKELLDALNDLLPTLNSNRTVRTVYIENPSMLRIHVSYDDGEFDKMAEALGLPVTIVARDSTAYPSEAFVRYGNIELFELRETPIAPIAKEEVEK